MKYLVILFSIKLVISLKFTEKFAWSTVDYNWSSHEHRQEAIDSGNYIPENNLILGVERWRSKIFISVPRWKPGVASALNFVNLNSEEISPKLNPYPSWESNYLPNPRKNSSIISTFRIKADEKDRLWIIDSGYVDILKDEQISPFVLLIFNLENDELIRRYEFPKRQTVELKSALTNIVVDGNFAYITDTGAYGLIVYSFDENRSWRIEQNLFSFDPLLGSFNLEGKVFQWRGGIFGITLGSTEEDLSRKIYFHSIISTKEFMVSNFVLQNESYAISDSSIVEYSLIGDRGMLSFSGPEVFDSKTKIIFYTLAALNGIGCWNTEKGIPENGPLMLDQDSKSLVFPNDIRLDEERNLWVVTDRLFHFIQEKLDYEDINYRILTGHVDELIQGTECDG